MGYFRNLRQLKREREKTETETETESRVSFTSSSPDYWTHRFPVKTFCENFNMTSRYVENTMVL